MSEEKQDPYDGLSPYGIAVTALERILELDSGWMSWDEARGIASEAHGLAVAVAAHAAEKAGRAAPDLRDLVADWRKTADVLKDRHGVGDARERNTLEVVIGQVQAIQVEPRPAPELQATEALYRFAHDGHWLTCTDDGRLDPRAELLAVKRAVQEAFDAARPPAGTALLADLRDRMGVGEPVDRPGDQWEPKPAPELAAAMAETRHYREALEQVAKHHDNGISAVRVIAKIAKRALEAK